MQTLNFVDDVKFTLNKHNDKLATVLLITIDDVVIFGTLVYNEYIDIFESAKKIIDVSENQDYRLLSFLNDNEEELLRMSVPPKLGAAFLSDPGFHRANAQTEPNKPTPSHKWDHVGLGWKYVDGDFVRFKRGGPMDLMVEE